MSDYFDRLEHQLVRAVETQPRRARPRLGVVLGPALATVVVLVVVVIAATAGRPVPGSSPGTGATPAAIVLQPSTLPAPVAALDADVVTLRHRLQDSFANVSVQRVGQTIVLGNARPSQRLGVEQLTVPGRVRLLDWETNALLPSGQTVAGGLRGENATALRISQGSGSAPAGTAAAGGMPLSAAVALAARQPAFAGSPGFGRQGARYYLFRRHCRVSAASSCLLSGPTASRAALLEALPPGFALAAARQLVVPAGILVAQATAPLPVGDPAARYFVLRDAPVLTGADMNDAQASTDSSGNPDVSFTFSAAGLRAFQRVTAAVAHRGDLVSSFGQTLDQHFAVILDDQILTVPQIDFKTYPDGINGASGSDITELTSRSARQLATLLSTRPLAAPLTVRP